MKPHLLLILIALLLLAVAVLAWRGLATQPAILDDLAVTHAAQPLAQETATPLAAPLESPSRTDVGVTMERPPTNPTFSVNSATATIWSEGAGPGTATIFGRAVDISGRGPPLLGGRVFLVQRDGRNRTVAADLAPDGSYSAPALERGTWTLTCEVLGYEPASAEVTIVAADERAQRDFELQARVRLRLCLQDATGRSIVESLRQEKNSALAALRPVLTERCPARGNQAGARLGSVKFRTQHDLTQDPRVWCVVETSCQPSLFVSAVLGDCVLDAQAVPLGADEVVLVITPAQIEAAVGVLEVLVLDDFDGAPLPAAVVSLRPPMSQELRLSTDAAGRARFEQVLPGEVVLSVRAADRIEEKRTLRVAAGRGGALETVRVARGTSISGWVRSSGGAPLTSAITCRAASVELGEWPLRTVRSSSDGSFRFEGLRPGAYILRADFVAESVRVSPAEHVMPPGTAYVDVRASSATGVVLTAPDGVPERANPPGAKKP